MLWSADFETTTDPKDCRVWLWGIAEIGAPDNFIYGNDIESFIKFCEDQKDDVFYFHNLKFDGEFILSYLLNNGYFHNDEKSMHPKSFQTLISDTGQFYQMKICFDRPKKRKAIKATFKDSLKKLPLSVDEIAKAFKLPISKLEIDYDLPRPKGWQPTPEEIEYIKHDVQIVAQALQIQFDQDLTRLTIGADALNNYKKSRRDWKQLFPVLDLEVDARIRLAYKGGWTYANPKYQAGKDHPNRCVGKGMVLDVNSLYPSVMYDRWLPCGIPIWFDGKYEYDASHPLYIQYLTAIIKIKPDHLPTLQIKGSPFFLATEYVTDSEGTVELALTSVDMKLLFDQYDVEVIRWNGGYKFRRCKGIFCSYIDYWMDVKANNTGGIRQIAKLMLNSLYGKFATNPDVTQKIPYLKPTGEIAYKLGIPELRDPIYTAIACFITAYAREVTIRAAQANYDRFLYADTDSLHLLGQDAPDLRIHPTDLGAWSEEALFSKGKYLRAKTYIERITHEGVSLDGQMHMERVDTYDDVKCAGMPKAVKKDVTFKNFVRGNSWNGKLLPHHVKGGIILKDTEFTLI